MRTDPSFSTCIRGFIMSLIMRLSKMRSKIRSVAKDASAGDAWVVRQRRDGGGFEVPLAMLVRTSSPWAGSVVLARDSPPVVLNVAAAETTCPRHLPLSCSLEMIPSLTKGTNSVFSPGSTRRQCNRSLSQSNTEGDAICSSAVGRVRVRRSREIIMRLQPSRGGPHVWASGYRSMVRSS